MQPVKQPELLTVTVRSACRYTQLRTIPLLAAVGYKCVGEDAEKPASETGRVPQGVLAFQCLGDGIGGQVLGVRAILVMRSAAAKSRSSTAVSRCYQSWLSC